MNTDVKLGVTRVTININSEGGVPRRPDSFLLANHLRLCDKIIVKFSDSEPGRKHLPHLAPLEFSNQTILQHITVCVKQRRPLLARPEIINLLLDCWRKADHWMVGRWVVMPDHLHLFCAPVKFPPASLKLWMRFWLNESTRRWPYSAEKPVWQRDFFDRQLRSGESYHQKWLYVWENPIKDNLVQKPEDWPYQGEMNVIPWHEAG